jgi:TPR repeat protein
MTGQNNEEKAVEAYEKALSINKNLPETLNNLAWIYITSENDKIQNTEKGIKLAEKAADLTDLQKSYLLDTLAEGYFRNRNFEKACIYAKKAYENAEENKEYYQDQLAKICKQR